VARRGSDRQALQSLDFILGETRAERGAQLQHFDGLDAKAGILLGFSGAIVALAPADAPLLGLGRVAAVPAGLASLWAFWPRQFDTLDLYTLRQKYLSAELRFTKLTVLDTQVAIIESAAAFLNGKAKRVKLAMALLAVAVVLIAIGLELH